jgi:hypothetical protein
MRAPVWQDHATVPFTLGGFTKAVAAEALLSRSGSGFFLSTSKHGQTQGFFRGGIQGRLSLRFARAGQALERIRNASKMKGHHFGFIGSSDRDEKLAA